MIYVFLAHGFEEIEALTPVDILRRAGGEVVTVGVGGRAVCGSHGITVTADVSDSDLNGFSGCEAVILPGGIPGTPNLEKSDVVCSFIKYAYENGKPIGAICAAPTILGRMGILKGKDAICYAGLEDQLAGANIKDEPVVKDGNIITARGAGVALEFALKLTEVLFGTDTARKIESGILCAR